MKYALLLTMLATLLLLPKPMIAQFPFDECSNTEAWVPIGQHDTLTTVARPAEMNGDLYVITADGRDRYLNKWDGSTWTSLGLIPLMGLYREITDMVAYEGKLYVTGPFSSIGFRPGTNGLACWNGTAWEGVAGNKLRNDSTFILGRYLARMFKLTTFNGELVISGVFAGEDNGTHEGILTYDGSSWKVLGDAHLPDVSDSGYVTTMVEWKGALYVGGYFGAFGGVRVAGVARWDGTAWSRVGTREMRAVQRLIPFNGELYLLHDEIRRFQGRDSEAVVERWDGTDWSPVRGLLPRRRSGDNSLDVIAAEVYNGSLYLMVTEGGYGRVAVRWDGAAPHPLAMTNGDVRWLTTYRGELIAGGAFASACGVRLDNFAKLCTTGGCSGISGRVMIDPSGDCAVETGKPGFPGSIVEVMPGPRYAVTDSSGYYRVMPEPGSYTVGLVGRRYWMQNCPASPGTRSASIALAGDSSIANNFSVAPQAQVRDLRISLAAGRARAGDTRPYTITCTNTGTLPVANCTLRFIPGQYTTFVDADPAPGRKGFPAWTLTDIKAGESRTIHLECTVSRSAPLWATICDEASVDVIDDNDSTDNVARFCAQVRGSYDPNDMAVAPAGDLLNIIGRGDSVLTYTVRFQNTGNDTAFRVVVIDTLSPSLDLPTLVLGASSHPFTLRFGEHGAVIWDFRGINLPDSATYMARSQGYFSYSVRLRKGLAPNTAIRNSANIYFDYNAPVTTNTVTTVTPGLSEVRREMPHRAMISVYPNPTRGMAYLRGSIASRSTIEVRDMLGVLVRSVRHEGSGDAAIDLSGLGAGVYMVSARTGAGDGVARVMVVK